jgi:hypothetical protein
MSSRIDLTECARRYGWRPNKSGRNSVRRWFLATSQQREGLAYDVTTGRGMVDQNAFMLALARVREERRSTKGPAGNLGAHARKGLGLKERAAVFAQEKRRQRNPKRR